jgi:ankyrin repeat protein
LEFAYRSGKFDFNVQNLNGRTPLEYAIRKGRAELFVYLLGLDPVDLQIRNKAFMTARQSSLIFTVFYKVLK